MSGIGITFWLNPTVEVNDYLEVLFKDALKDYFHIHTASVAVDHGALSLEKDNNRVITVLGGFESLNLQLISYAELVSPFFRLLPVEQVNLEHLWTTTNLPSCTNKLVNHIQQIQANQSWQTTIFGDVNIKLPYDSIEYPSKVFRQVYANIDERKRKSWISDVYYGALVYITINSDQKRSTKSIAFRTTSDIWLRNGQAFRQLAYATADENTKALAQCIRGCALALGDALDRVEWDGLEGKGWVEEADRIWETFQIIPSIRLG